MNRFLFATAALTLSSAAFAADLPQVQIPAPAVFSWTGCYVGGNLGAGWGHANSVDPNASFGGGLGLFAPTGEGVGIDQGGSVLAGGQVGCDAHFATHWVIGLAGDFSWTNINGSTADPFAFAGGDSLFGGMNGIPATLHDHTQWLASVTPRLGFAWNRWMLYGKGGVAWEHSTDSIQNLSDWGTPGFFCAVGGAFAACNPSGTDTAIGWTAGVGVTWAFADYWSAGIEYDHYGFGRHTVSLTDTNVAFGSPSAPITVGQQIDVVKLMLDYHFTWIAR